jgi:hypothetical protein
MDSPSRRRFQTRHCERQRSLPPFVIASASEAIHAATQGSMDCFVACAPRNDGGTRIHLLAGASTPVIASEAKQSIPPRKEAWIASSRALLAMTEETRIHLLAALPNPSLRAPAKQSIGQQGKYGLLRRFAPRNDGGNTDSPSRRRFQTRHCERQRSHPSGNKAGMDCFVAIAPRNDGGNTDSPSRGASRPVIASVSEAIHRATRQVWIASAFAR